jgi:hypothetical protein
MAIALAAFVVLAFGPALFNCGDTNWHLAAGDWILAHRAVPHVDPFSFTLPGMPWVAHEWLAEVVMAVAFALAGWSGVAILFSAIFAAVLLVIGAHAGRHLPPIAILVLLALVTVALTTTALARPHVGGWLLLAVWLTLLLRARDGGRAPPLAAALLMMVWANLHASFLFGLALCAALAGEALLARARPAVLAGWAAFGLLAGACALATPHGIAGLLFPVQLSAMRTLPLITEWQAASLSGQPGFFLLLGVGVYMLATRRVRVPPVRALIVAGVLIMALAHARHQAIFAIVAPMLLAAPIGRALPAPSTPAPAPAGWPLLAALIAAMLGAAIARIVLPATERDGPTNPVATIDALPPALLRQPVLNGYDFGGALIRRGVPVFIDGRADMYGDAFMEEYARLYRGDLPAFRAATARYRLRWTILPPAAPLAAALDREPGWQRLRSDRLAIVHVRLRPEADTW